MVSESTLLLGQDIWQSGPQADEDNAEKILQHAWALHQKVTKPRLIYDERVTPIRGLKKVLKPYQYSGIAMIRCLEDEFGGALLADEMGLGKTLTTLALIRDQRDRQVVTQPTLIIVDKILLADWKREMLESFPDMLIRLGTILNTPD